MSDNTAVLIINAITNKENMAEVKSYLESIMPILVKNGGKPIARYKTIQQLAGEESPEMIAIVEFSSAETIQQMMNGDDFSGLSELRAKAFTKLNLMICSSM